MPSASRVRTCNESQTGRGEVSGEDADAELLKRIRVHTDARATLGYRRVPAFLNREGKSPA